MSNSLKAPVSAKLTKRTRTEWDELIRKREQLNEERKHLDRTSALVAKQVSELDAELTAWLEHETAGEKEQQLSLKSFILFFVWQKPSAMAQAFKAWGKLSPPEKAEVAAECGDKRKLAIQWREAPPPASSAAA